MSAAAGATGAAAPSCLAAAAATSKRRFPTGALLALLYLLGAVATLRSTSCSWPSLEPAAVTGTSGGAPSDGSDDGTAPDTVPVFYNLFVGEESDTPRVRALVLEQLAYGQPVHRVFAHTIGVPLAVPGVTELEHHEEGTEIDTLHSLWEYCTINPQAKVVYLHSKGSYTPIPQNDHLRRFLTAGALSRECLHLPSTCDVCSARFSPIPHPHTPGNMWLARCDYVQRLLDPRTLQRAMERSATPHAFPGCVGRGRYAAEHWVLSHPAARPCDLHPDGTFTWAYLGIPPPDAPRRLVVGPRFPLETYIISDMCRDVGQTVEWRTREYAELYNTTPAPDWWGWAFYNHSRGVRPENYVFKPRGRGG